MTEGWDKFSPERKAEADAKNAALAWQQAEPYRVFLTAAGEQVIRELRAMTYLASTAGPPALTPEMALYKEAQSNLVRMIDKRIAAAAAGPPRAAAADETTGE